MATLFYMMGCSERRREKGRKNEYKTTQKSQKQNSKQREGDGKSGAKKKTLEG